MIQDMDLYSLNEKIQTAKSLVEQVRKDAGNFPAVMRNTERILTGFKMLELNISDVLDLDTDQP